METNQNNNSKIIDELLKTKKNIETEIDNEIDHIKKVNLFAALTNLDKSIEYYSNKFSKYLNKDEIKQDKKQSEKKVDSNNIKKVNNPNTNKKEKKIIDKDQIRHLKLKYGKNSFTYYDNITNINIEYKYKSESAIIINYNCSRRCGGTAKRLLINDEIIITKHCNIDPKNGGKNHNKITFNEFYKLYNENKIDINTIKEKEDERYLIRAIIKKNQSIVNEKIREIFFEICKKNTTISNTEINTIRKKEIGIFNNLDLIDLCKKLTNNIIAFNIYSFDTMYNISKKNIVIKKEQKAIIIDNKNTYAFLNKENNDEYFIDITFKIMPKKYTNYKLMIITCINKKTNSTKICCFIAFKYQDVESYIRIFGLLYII